MANFNYEQHLQRTQDRRFCLATPHADDYTTDGVVDYERLESRLEQLSISRRIEKGYIQNQYNMDLKFFQLIVDRHHQPSDKQSYVPNLTLCIERCHSTILWIANRRQALSEDLQYLKQIHQSHLLDECEVCYDHFGAAFIHIGAIKEVLDQLDTQVAELLEKLMSSLLTHKVDSNVYVATD